MPPFRRMSESSKVSPKTSNHTTENTENTEEGRKRTKCGGTQRLTSIASVTTCFCSVISVSSVVDCYFQDKSAAQQET